MAKKQVTNKLVLLPLKIEENQVLPLRHENKIAPAVGEVLLNTDIDQASETSLEV